MENIISELKADGLEIKLTSDKLYLNSAISQETIALRSVSGIAVIDLVDDFNKKLSAWKLGEEKINNMNRMAKPLMIIGLVCLGYGLALAPKDNKVTFILLGVFLAVGGFYSKGKGNELPEPSMKSQVQIFTSGGTREFNFDKKSIQSGNVAEFIARVEDTLTAFHKA